MIGDNPAARLLSILEEGKSYKAHESCRSVWQKIFKITDNNDSILMSRLGKSMELPNDIITILNRDFPNQKGTYIHWSNQVNTAFFRQNLNDVWNSFNSHIDDHTLTYLRLNADLIQTKTPTSLIEPIKLKETRDKVSQLLNELIENNLPLDVKDYLARSLHKIIQAIDEYRISGATPVMDAIDGTFGHAFFNEEYKNTLSNSEFGQKIVSVLSIVADTMSIVLGIPQLPQAVSAYLEFLKNT